MEGGMGTHFAHISEDKKREQTIREHLEGTGKLAQKFAKEFGCGDWGYGIGLLHDIGKYSEKFQKRLKGGPITDHASAGAKELFHQKNYPGAYCIAGHHSGLLDGGGLADSGGEATLMGRMKKDLEDYNPWKEEVKIPAFSPPPLRQLGKGGFSLSFFIRMLFSCLVDADYLDTEAFMSGKEERMGNADSIDVLYASLKKYVGKWMETVDESTVNGRRSMILKSCFEKGREDKGVFQLTVPTGGGKTLSSLAFALEHGKRHQMRRIIYVIPYTSIIEQNAQVFREVLGEKNVLEDHSNYHCDSPEELRLSQLASENWERPVVVTTNVQFFESLFSNKSSKCRKLHNIANSILIFDEAQMLPVNFLKPCIQSISELVYNYRCTAVICTATQPSIKKFFPKEIKIKEICPDTRGQYEFFKRTEFKNKGEMSEEELIHELREEKQVLCILNSRRQVQRVYDRLKGESTFHLSTLMYPEHRKRILDKIRRCLAEDKPCCVIATSLVEAGVDLDFAKVYRELAGIDSVIQAAGRCNREGKRKKETSPTNVFTLEKSEGIHLPSALKQPIAIASQIREKYEDIVSLEAVEEYFRRLFDVKGESLDTKNIIGQMEAGVKDFLFPFATVSKEFSIIEDNTTTIFINKEERADFIEKHIRSGKISRQLMREAGHYCVNIYDKDFEALNGSGRLEEIVPNLYSLRNKEEYTEDMGLSVNVSRGEAVFF